MYYNPGYNKELLIGMEIRISIQLRVENSKGPVELRIQKNGGVIVNPFSQLKTPQASEKYVCNQYMTGSSTRAFSWVHLSWYPRIHVQIMILPGDNSVTTEAIGLKKTWAPGYVVVRSHFSNIFNADTQIFIMLLMASRVSNHLSWQCFGQRTFKHQLRYYGNFWLLQILAHP